VEVQSNEVVYAFLQGGRPRELHFVSLRDAFDRACGHLEGEEAMVFQIRQGERIAFTGMDIIELYPDWIEWRARGGSHPVECHGAS